MAGCSETDKLMNSRSSILDEDDELKVKEENGDDIDLFISEEGDENNAPSKSDRVNLSSADVDAFHKDQDGPRGKTILSPPSYTSLGFDGPTQEDDLYKSVKFADDLEVYDLDSKAATPISVSLDTPIRDVDIPHIDIQSDILSKDSPAVLPVVGDNGIDGSSLGKGSGALRPSDLVLSAQSTDKEQPSSTSETTQEGEPAGHKHFDVSNVDESVLRKEMENKEQDFTIAKSDLENRPLLEKIPNVFSDEYFEHSMNRANQDTIGPLENPTFLRMLNYSVR